MIQRKKRKYVESELQTRVVTWMRYKKIPHHSIPNEGSRSAIQGSRLVRQGMWPGASDLFICRMAGKFGGFYVELKKPGELPKEHQLHFMEKMRQEGYKAEWFDNFMDAINAIEAYVNVPRETLS